MPQGQLSCRIADLTGHAVRDRVEMDFKRFPGEPGAGGEAREVAFRMGGDHEIIITRIPCRGGAGTMYKVRAALPHYRPYRFYQLIREDAVSPASDDIEFWVKPGHVRGIRAPGFEALPAHVQAILDQARMRAQRPRDRDLVGKRGKSLYGKLGPLRKACLLNISKKASHPSADQCLFQLGGLLICRQDRFFAFVRSTLPDRLQQSPVFKSAKNWLHEPPSGFRMTGRSFKSRDSHANLQLTFMAHIESGKLAADIDIDESAGIEHGFEVIRNALFRKRTNPYLIREFMLNADAENRSLDPGYAFVF